MTVGTLAVLLPMQRMIASCGWKEIANILLPVVSFAVRPTDFWIVSIARRESSGRCSGWEKDGSLPSKKPVAPYLTVIGTIPIYYTLLDNIVKGDFVDKHPRLTSLLSILTSFFFVGMFVLGLVGCTTRASTIILATTTSTYDSGLLDVLLPEFTKRTGIQVKPVAVGTGEAMAMGERGEADVLLVHAREAEDKFMAEGFGAVRKDVMHNDFVLIGLVSDPAGIRDLDSAGEAFQRIAKSKSLFISRGDDSGTHKKELQIWKEAGVIAQGEWYIESGQGMGETVRIADEKGAYTLSDRGTYLSLKDTVRLEVLIEGDEILFNPYGVIAVNPEKFPNVNFQGAMEFIKFITSVEGQNIIKNFGLDKYGEPLFYPDALE